MKILFWNTHRNTRINKYISSLVHVNKIDILVLAEYEANSDDLYKMIRSRGDFLQEYASIGCERINVFGNYRKVEPSVQDKHYSIQIINREFILCGVHLPSNLHGDMSREPLMKIRTIVHDIQEEEEKFSTQRTIIVGDFNEMPYAEACLNADAFHGLPVYETNKKMYRIVGGNKFKKYYNPMWNFFGDFSYPPGTYYRNNSFIYSPMWYMLDQFIFGKDIIPLLNKEQLKIITKCEYGSLADRNGHPDKNISDHFPIMCEISD